VKGYQALSLITFHRGVGEAWEHGYIKTVLKLTLAVKSTSVTHWPLF